jgi:hypothetical protein
MSINLAELGIQRKLTHAFILTQPVELALVPRQRVKKPAGGWAYEEQAPRAPQTMRLVEPSGWPRPTVTQDGIERVVDFMLLGDWDAEIGLYDRFTHDGAEWEVIDLMHFNGWERRASVARRA